MKTTIKLSPMEAVVVTDDGSSVALSFTVGSIQVAKKVFDLAKIGAVLAAIEGAAEQAQRYQTALDNAARVG